MKIRRMCGGAIPPWRLKYPNSRWGFMRPRRASGALIIDNLGIAIVYATRRGDW